MESTCDLSVFYFLVFIPDGEHNFLCVKMQEIFSDISDMDSK